MLPVLWTVCQGMHSRASRVLVTLAVVRMLECLIEKCPFMQPGSYVETLSDTESALDSFLPVYSPIRGMAALYNGVDCYT